MTRTRSPPPHSNSSPRTAHPTHSHRSAVSDNPSQRTLSAQHAPTLPPVASLTGFITSSLIHPGANDGGSPTMVRAFGVNSMLNPTNEQQGPPKPGPRVNESPGSNVGSLAGPYQTPLVSPKIRKRREDTSPSRVSQAPSEGRPHRRMLTPKSPALRSLSQGVRRSPSVGGLAGMALAPLDSRVYTAEPGDSAGSAIPPLPSIQFGAQGMHGHLQHHENVANVASASYTNSTASYSAQGYVGSPSGSSSLAEREAPSPYRQPAGLESVPGFGGAQGGSGSYHQMRPSPRSYNANPPSSYQMELSTDAGPMIVPVEVDTLQASKLADEKRKRNAGASARFRQRRKEKEQAASQHIAELEKQVRQLTQERNFYVAERNFFRDTLSRTPGVNLPARPQSPGARPGQAPPSYTAPANEGPTNLEYSRHELGEPSPAQRRRTSDYQPSFGAAPSIAQSGYGAPPPPPVPSPASAPTPHSSHPATIPAPPGQYAQPGSGYTLPPPAAQAGPVIHPAHHSQQNQVPPPSGMRSQSYDPFRRDHITR